MFYILAFSLALSSVITSVSAHGFVHTLQIDGQSYAGWNPFVDPYASPIPERIVRKIPSDGPKDASDPNLACNTGGEDGTGMVADATAGSVVQFQWDYWPGDHLGPVSTYMTSCNGDCTNFDVNGAKWFKLDAAGYDNGVWASATLIADGFTWNSTIPSALAPGQYLLRHEIVALHSNPAQYYPSCSQINVSGTGSGQPSAQSLVTIPGLYNGVQWPNIYSDFGSFTTPGPPPVSFDDSGADPSPGPSSSGAVVTTAAASSPSTPTAVSIPPSTTAGPLGQCLLTPRRLSRKRSLSKRF